MTEFWAEALANTAIVVGGTTALSCLIAVPAAWLLERTDVLGARRIGRLLTLPYALPSFLLAIAWIALANPSVGWINLLAGRGPGSEAPPIVNVYGLTGIVLIEASALFSILFLGLRAGFRRLDPSFEEAARLAGASPLRTLWSISFPLLRGPFFSGFVSVALASLASFAVPAMIGGPARKFVVTTGIYSLIKEGTPESFHTALWISMAVAGAALVGILFLHQLRGHGASLVGGKASRPSLTPLGAARLPATLGLWLFVAIAFAVPTAALVLASLQLNPGSFEFGLRAWHYVLFDLMDFQTAVRTSALASIGAALLVLGSAFVLSIAPGPKRRFVAARIENLALVLYSMPGTSLALALVAILAWLPGGALLTNGLGILVLAYALKYALLGIRTVKGSAELVHGSLIESARLAGAGPVRIAFQIWFPLLKPALGAALVLVLLPCLSECTMTLLLYGPGTENLGVLLFQLQEYADRAAAAVVGTLLLITVFVLQWTLSRFERKQHES